MLTLNLTLSLTLILAATLTLKGHLVWFVERNRNSEQFPVAYLEGIDDSFWFAAVTFTTGALE